MKKIIFIIIFIIVIIFNNNIYADDDMYLKDSPYMTIDVQGFADNDGRIILTRTIQYMNPKGEEIEINDLIVLDNFYSSIFVNHTIEKPENINISRNNNGDLIIYGKTDKNITLITIQQEYMLRSNNKRFGREYNSSTFLYMNNDNRALPLKSVDISIDFTSSAKYTNRSFIECYPKNDNKSIKYSVEKSFRNSPRIETSINDDKLMTSEDLHMEIYYYVPNISQALIYFILILNILILVYFYHEIRKSRNHVNNCSTIVKR